MVPFPLCFPELGNSRLFAYQILCWEVIEVLGSEISFYIENEVRCFWSGSKTFSN